MTLDPKSELTRQWLQVATEDLDLVALCQQIDPSFSSLTVPAARVSPYGTAFRYPPIAAGPTSLDALEALGLARDALAFVMARLPATVRP